MKKQALCLCYFLIFSAVSIAQYQLTGTVLDVTDNHPLSGASVFINNSSKGTTTDKNGNFSITDISFNSFELVISYVSYETIIVPISAQNIGKRFKIGMSPKQNQLQEVVIGPVEKDGWKTWGTLFSQYFIGTSNNAKQCSIINPDVLRFIYNKKTQVLRVSSVDKLIVNNNALGYTINYQLEEFVLDRRKRMVTYIGYSSFKPKISARKRRMDVWEKSRREAYNGSLMHFMKSLYYERVEEEGFKMIPLIRLYKNDTATKDSYNRIISGNYSDVDTSLYSVQLMRPDDVFNSTPIIYLVGKKPLPASLIRKTDSTGKTIYAFLDHSIQLTYTKEFERPEYAGQQSSTRKGKVPQTSIIFLTNNRPIVIEKSGLYFEPLDLFTEGYLAWEKLGEMMPVDYEVKN